MVDSMHYSLFLNHRPELVVSYQRVSRQYLFLAENLSLTTDISRQDLGTEFAQRVPLIFAKIL